MNRENAAKLGAAVVVGSAILITGLIVLLGLSLWEETESYYLSIDGDVHGLSQGSPVEIRGVRVGQVEAIRLFPESAPDAIGVELSVAAEVPVYDGAYAQLSFQGVGVSGQRYVSIQAGDPAKGRAPPGSEIPVEATKFERVTDRIVEIAGEAENLLASTSTLVTNIDAIVTAIDGRAVQAMVEDARATLHNLQTSTRRVDELFAENRRALARTVDDAAATAERARVVFGEAEFAMKQIEELVLKLSTAVDANDDELQATLRNLRRASQSMAVLGQQLERDPSRLLFSSSPKPRELP